MAGRGGGDHNDQINPIMAMATVGLVLWLIWITKHEAISAVVLFVRGLQISVISLFTQELDQLGQWVRGIPRHMVTFSDLLQVSNMTGGYLRWVFSPILIGCALWIMMGSKRDKFKTKYNEKSLAVAESVNWAHTRLFNDLNLSDMDLDSGSWAAAKTERMFVAEHQLRLPDGGLNRNRATAVLQRQLGPLWTGYSGVHSRTRRAMFALFCARIAGTQPVKPSNRGKSVEQYRKELKAVEDHAAQALKLSDQMISHFASTMADGKLDLSCADAVVRRYGNHPLVKKICAAHAYELCVLISLYEQSKKVMPLPPNWLRWVKGIDRVLWYCLHNNGMRIPFVEVCGIDAHRKVELAVGKPMQMPVVEKAVDGLEMALAEYADDTEGIDNDEMEEDEDDAVNTTTASKQSKTQSETLSKNQGGSTQETQEQGEQP